MTVDWHQTQNEDYLKLLIKRLDEPKLIWVNQFVDLINKSINNETSSLSIKDIGCNVGHFYRGLEDIKINCSYYGYDISETYLNIAKSKFPNANFQNLNIETDDVELTDITVISATFEHLQLHEKAFEKILNSTKCLILLRTFIGDSYLDEDCYKDGANLSYKIKQFTINYFESLLADDWLIEVVDDIATNSSNKCVCKNIYRKQKVLIFKRKQWNC